MSHVPHELAEEFPNLIQQIHDRKGTDAHFARIVDQYHEINRAIHRAETLCEPVEPMVETRLRKERVALKDEIYQMLKESV